jgi:hypothetical protein
MEEKNLKKAKFPLSRKELGMSVLKELSLRVTDRALIARIDASRFDSTSLGRFTREFRCVHLVTDLPDVGSVGVKLVPHGEGADDLAVSAQDAAALPETDVIHHGTPPLPWKV